MRLLQHEGEVVRVRNGRRSEVRELQRLARGAQARELLTVRLRHGPVDDRPEGDEDDRDHAEEQQATEQQLPVGHAGVAPHD